MFWREIKCSLMYLVSAGALLAPSPRSGLPRTCPGTFLRAIQVWAMESSSAFPIQPSHSDWGCVTVLIPVHASFPLLYPAPPAHATVTGSDFLSLISLIPFWNIIFEIWRDRDYLLQDFSREIKSPFGCEEWRGKGVLKARLLAEHFVAKRSFVVLPQFSASGCRSGLLKTSPSSSSSASSQTRLILEPGFLGPNPWIYPLLAGRSRAVTSPLCASAGLSAKSADGRES